MRPSVPSPSILRLALVWNASALLTAQAAVDWSAFTDRNGHAMATDAAGNAVVYGGFCTPTSNPAYPRFDTLQFGASAGAVTVRSVPLAASPGALQGHAMARAGSLLVLFGGRVDANGPFSRVTAYHDGSSWQKQSRVFASGPTARSGHAMTADLVRGKAVLFGGQDANGPLADTWEFDPVSESWLQLAPSILPAPGTTTLSPRAEHSLAFEGTAINADGSLGKCVLFGGTTGGDETWLLERTIGGALQWRQTSTTAGPSSRRAAAMATHTQSARVVLFGGTDAVGSVLPPETWTFDATAETWTLQTPAASPTAVHHHAMAEQRISPTGTRILLAGGIGGDRGRVWQWDGATWSPLARPQALRWPAMAFDENGVGLLFGGEFQSTGPRNETWRIDGHGFALQPSSPIEPGPRVMTGLTYDSARDRFVLFGGNTGTGLASDTWEHDGSQWIPVTTSTTPPPSARSIAFDAGRSRTVLSRGSTTWLYDGTDWSTVESPPHISSAACVLATWNHRPHEILCFGGNSSTGGTTYEGTTWAWRGSQWVRLVTSNSPSPRMSMGVAFDAARNQVVLYGGISAGGRLAETWIFDGSDWSLATPAASPGPRSNFAMTYDSARSRCVVFGGVTDLGSTNAETWEWDGTNWIFRSDLLPSSPSPRNSHRIAYDPSRGRTILFGGYDGNSLGDTWDYDGVSWNQRFPTNSPAASHYHMTSFDPLRQAVVIHGCDLGNETYWWNGADWTPIAVTQRPDALCEAALVQSTPDRPGVVLFGGLSAPVLFGRATWHLGSGTWTELSSGAPADLDDTATAYDPLRGVVVLFGGSDAGSPSNETWEWNGTVWMRRAPAGPIPTARHSHAMTFDASRGVVVLAGGRNGLGNLLADVFEWNGIVWNERFPAQPEAMADLAMSYDPARESVTAFGEAGFLDFAPVRPARAEEYYVPPAGCAGGSRLRVRPDRRAWIDSTFVIDLDNAPPNTVPLMLLGFSNRTFSGLPLPAHFPPLLPGCALAVDFDPALMQFSFPNASYAIPNDPFFVGLSVYVQAAHLDFAGNFGVSNAMQCVMGRR